ncbi:type II secretion system F family protein [Yinghuangia sp. ASG 101]|uniref:type II secretion system F family protein n=1 Tax=Yinghuangia sp. ASG 101 TaxID=2896848 RepID=UPI001E3858A2|nr:type II secretion system F family protein [Yinghuangia sp. ASG 101]UGQ09102.1 type II secretion system F family protein [Yinghuangia sp. ASG 101]
MAALAAGVAGGLFLGGTAGWIAVPCVAALVDRQLARLPTSADRTRRQRISADLPVAADLLSACLVAGATPVTAVATVASAVGGPLGDELRAAASAVHLGGDPARCWSALSADPELAPLGRALARSGDGGAPLAERIAHVADECRERRRSALTTTARRTAVRATLPLGACFLPAFLVIGVVPVVIGLAAPLLGHT